MKKNYRTSKKPTYERRLSLTFDSINTRYHKKYTSEALVDRIFKKSTNEVITREKVGIGFHVAIRIRHTSTC